MGRAYRFERRAAAEAESSESKSGKRNADFFAEVTSGWGTLRDSDRPFVAETWLEKFLRKYAGPLKFVGYALILYDVLSAAIELPDIMLPGFIVTFFEALPALAWVIDIATWLLDMLAAVIDYPATVFAAIAMNFGLLALEEYKDRHPSFEHVSFGRRDKRRIEHIWTAESPVRFGCGTRGMSIVGSDRLSYFFWWDKIEFIYFENDPRNLSFEKLYPSGKKGKPVVVDENRDFFLMPSSRIGNAVNRGAVKVRLRPGNSRQPFIEEIVIPARFLTTNSSPGDANEFVEACWEYKWRHAHLTGKRHKVRKG